MSAIFIVALISLMIKHQNAGELDTLQYIYISNLNLSVPILSFFLFFFLFA